MLSLVRLSPKELQALRVPPILCGLRLGSLRYNPSECARLFAELGEESFANVLKCANWKAEDISAEVAKCKAAAAPTEPTE